MKRHHIFTSLSNSSFTWALNIIDYCIVFSTTLLEVDSLGAITEEKNSTNNLLLLLLEFSSIYSCSCITISKKLLKNRGAVNTFFRKVQNKSCNTILTFHVWIYLVVSTNSSKMERISWSTRLLQGCRLWKPKSNSLFIKLLWNFYTCLIISHLQLCNFHLQNRQLKPRENKEGIGELSRRLLYILETFRLQFFLCTKFLCTKYFRVGFFCVRFLCGKMNLCPLYAD